MNDLKADWPNDVENAELTRLGAELSSAASPLSHDALARIESKLRLELDILARRHARRRVVLGWSVAASVLLALAGYASLRSPTDAPRAPAQIDDRFSVALGDASNGTPGKPLVALDEYRSLFSD